MGASVVVEQQDTADDDHDQSVEHRKHAVPLEKQQPFEVAAKVEYEGVEKLVEGEDGEKGELMGIVADKQPHGEGDYKVERQQKEFYGEDAAEILVDKVRVLGDVAGVEVGDAKVQQDVEDIGEVEDGEIESVGLGSDSILHANFNAKNPERLDDEVEQQYPKESGDEFFVQNEDLEIRRLEDWKSVKSYELRVKRDWVSGH